MAILFPSSPSPGDIFTSNGRSWQYINGKWEAYGEIIAPDVFSVDEVNDVVNVYGSLAAGASASIAGDLAVDTNTLFVDSATDRVGIGTETPANKLDVSGGLTVQGAALTQGLTVTNFGGSPVEIQGGMTVDTGTLHVDATNNRVGVGTTSPAQALDVAGSVNASQSVTIGEGGQITSGSIYSDGNWGMILRAKRANPAIADFRFANSSDVARMIIDTAGRVTTPSQPAFAVYHNGSTDVTYTGIVDFNTKKFDTGNNFNLTTDTFTAPVSGVYQFNWTSYTNAAAATGGYRASFYINGVQAMMNGHWGAAHNILVGTFYLNANDAVTLRAVNGFVVSFYGTDGHNLFSGFLVG